MVAFFVPPPFGNVIVPSLAFQASATAIGSGSTYTYNSQAIGPAAANRLVIVAVHSLQSAGARTISSVTVGGISATVIPGTTFTTTTAHGDYDSALYAASVPTGTTANIVVTMSGSVTGGGGGISVWAAYDLSSTTAIDGDGAINTSGSPANIPSLTTANSGFLVASAMAYAFGAFSVSWTNATKRSEVSVGSNPYVVISAADAATTGAGVAVTASVSGTIAAVLAIDASYG